MRDTQTQTAQKSKTASHHTSHKFELLISNAIKTVLEEWPDGKENLSGPIVMNISPLLCSGRLRRATDFMTAKIRISTIVADLGEKQEHGENAIFPKSK
jgi:hypothetical protein